MKCLHLARCVLSISLAAAVLAACGGSSQPPTGAPGAMPQTRTIGAQRNGGQRMQSEASRGDLLYVTDGELVKIYTYPQDTFVATLGNFGSVYGMCSDVAGDVFIPEYYQNTVLEYAHGGTSPIATINTIY